MMEQFRVFLVRVAICFLLPQLLLGGCSLIGYGIGTLADGDPLFGRSGSKGVEVSILSLREVKVGTSIAIALRDSRLIEGDYISIKEEDSDRYTEQYLAALGEFSGERRVPVPSDSITFGCRNTLGLLVRDQFKGVDLDCIAVGPQGRRVLVSDLDLLRINDRSQDGLPAFIPLVYNRTLPSLSRGIVVELDGRITEVLVADVVRVEVLRRPGIGKWIGLGVGAVIDVIILAKFEGIGFGGDCGGDWGEGCKGQGGGCEGKK